jgi:hypothetical protein
MPNLIPSIPIDADRQRNLRFGAGAVVRLERACNQPITEILQDLKEQARSKQMRVGLLLEILTAGCQHEDKGLTAEDLGDAMAQRYGRDWLPQLATLVPAIGEAIQAAFPAAKEALPNATEQPPAQPQ